MHRLLPFERRVGLGHDRTSHVKGQRSPRRDEGPDRHRQLEVAGRIEPADASAVNAAADRLESWIGPIRFVPRFRTPLQVELAASQ